MDINRREIYRYLGYGAEEPDDRIRAAVERGAGILEEELRPRSFYRVYPLRFLEDGVLDLFCFQVKSAGLQKNLADCEQIILFAATIGIETDRLIQKYSYLDMSMAVILQAVATAAIESYCDSENEKLRKQFLKEGRFLRPRFSPGYGDFPLTVQKQLTKALETEKTVGITLTDSCLMIPSKSVTAVIGVGKKELRCAAKGCEVCKKDDCLYRRG